jgi:cysteine-rich repeat protein
MKRTGAVSLSMLIAVSWSAWLPRASAYPTYTASPGEHRTNCGQCHGDFRADGYRPPIEIEAWTTSLHDRHRFGMLAGDCNTCHFDPEVRNPVYTYQSLGGAGLAPIACVGCHGREEDAGHDSVSPGRGAGLRQHHTRILGTGPGTCAECHSDADPANYTPVGEDILPPYFFAPDATHPGKPTDSCNCTEDYDGSPRGLDNDGDGLYESLDPDCTAPPAVCGDGTVDPCAEECDDGNTSDGDCCAADCRLEPSGSPCPDDGNACTVDTCDGAGGCGTPVVCPACEACDPGAGGCVAALRLDCREPVAPGAARLTIKDTTPDAKDLLLWRWSKGAATSVADFGDPAGSPADGYTLCIYDLSDADPILLMSARAPAAGTCGTKPCWSPIGTKGFKYKQREGTPEGLQRLVLRSGEDGKAKITLKGGGEHLSAAPPAGLPALPLEAPVRTQLHGPNGACWEAGYSEGDVKKNDATQFRATGGPAGEG